MDDIISIMKDNINTQTEKFKNFHILKQGFCVTPPREEVEKKAEPLKGISKMHSIYIDSHGTLKGRELSCTKCLVNNRCEECDKK